jgi:hypothetical protein
MARMPTFIKQGGNVRPPRKGSPIRTVKQARAHFEKVGSVVRGGVKDADGSMRWILDHAGYSHGGVSDEGLIHIANEDARRTVKKD